MQVFDMTELFLGDELYGVIYSPENVEKGMKVPAIVYVYGGPCIQVLNS